MPGDLSPPPEREVDATDRYRTSNRRIPLFWAHTLADLEMVLRHIWCQDTANDMRTDLIGVFRPVATAG